MTTTTNKTNSSVAKVLRKALAAFGPNGENWEGPNKTGKMCSWGGIYKAAGFTHGAPDGEASRWAKHLGFYSANSLFIWNDDESRTWPDVKAKFEDAIAKAERVP